MSKITAELRHETLDKQEMFEIIKAVSSPDELYHVLEKKPGGWVLEAIARRFKIHELEACKKLQIYILYLGNGAVGRCAKYIDSIASNANEKQVKKVDLDNFMSFYPYTIPDF